MKLLAASLVLTFASSVNAFGHVHGGDKDGDYKKDGECDPFSWSGLIDWNDGFDGVCGPCAAVVDLSGAVDGARTCGEYCSGYGLACVGAAVTDWNTCTPDGANVEVGTPPECDTGFAETYGDSEAICECDDGGAGGYFPDAYSFHDFIAIEGNCYDDDAGLSDKSGGMLSSCATVGAVFEQAGLAPGATAEQIMYASCNDPTFGRPFSAVFGVVISDYYFMRECCETCKQYQM
mmetsp:Transcript_9628/g.19583  ORF Transcript_9628/g.19583 Transcript_9628/m.19583 type:complete len:234 (+) Transcript_9628:899-1600(+)|eukprot:CAMPEP_0118636168 /NCGR_PEP_ID=MMETSP0785-20121206/2469_1 /TAXON_ID=91992 /ORGANISM="Bolidomonas pacifica, Strain CCMP 1866" /LENGTH=233 /DNA_ID=CAMNT_0006527257 /DNA_START=80 /DNA_END=781 /DNA_ORIENTATION=+